MTRGQTIVLVGLGLVSAAGCVSKTSSCPASFEHRAEFDARLVELLAVIPRAKSAEQHTRRARLICYGPIEAGALTPEGTILLPANDEPATAARLAHLLVHLEQGFGQTPVEGTSGPSCVERALEAEASGWMVEFELREHHKLEVGSEFEAELRSVHPGTWPFRVERWLEQGEAPTWALAHYEGYCGLVPPPSTTAAQGDARDEQD